jgi:hypothetical protein
MDADIIQEALQTQDSSIDEVLWSMGISQNREELHTLRVLPLHLGGLGIPANVGCRTEKIRMLCLLRTKTFISQHYPALLQAFNDTTNGQDMRVGARQNMARGMQFEDFCATSVGIATARDDTAESVNEIESSLLDSFRDALVSQPFRRGHAARLISAASRGTSKWLTGFFTLGSEGTRFDEADFLEALRARMLYPLIPDGTRRVSCPFCSANLIEEPNHAVFCRRNHVIITERHDSVRDTLARFIKRVNPRADVTTEPVQLLIEGIRERRPDIYVTMENGILYAIDVAIVDPAAQTHLRAGDLSSHVNAGGAARQAEISKAAVYRGGRYEATLVPFVLESTGRLGPKACEFVEKIGGTAAGRRGELIKDFNVILARATGRCGVRMRSKLNSASAH